MLQQWAAVSAPLFKQLSCLGDDIRRLDIQTEFIMQEEVLGPQQDQTNTNTAKQEKKAQVPVQPIDDTQLFSAAYAERKSANLARVREYMGRRVASFAVRTGISHLLRERMGQKQHLTIEFLKALIKYFEDYVHVYYSLQKSLAKFEIKRKYPVQIGYAGVREAIEELVQLNDAESEQVQTFTDWIEKVLIEALKSAREYYRDRTKKLLKEAGKAEEEFDSAWSKQQKAYEKLSEGNDLLERQLTLMDKIKVSNELTIASLQTTHSCWQQMLEQEMSIKKVMEENMMQFHDRLTKFHRKVPKKADGAQGIYKYWSNLPKPSTAYVVYSSILDPKQCEYISFACNSTKLWDTFPAFIQMEHEDERLGNPFPLLEILTVKKFKGKVKKSERDWIEVKIIFTVDQNILLLDEKEGKALLKLKESSLEVLRASENILEIVGKEQGFIFDSRKKELIHFETLDQVEEFAYYVSTLSERKAA